MIPEAFLARMRDLLGAEFSDFAAALEAPDTHGLRVNRKKAEDERVLSMLGTTAAALPYVAGGYLVPSGERPGLHPAHAAGMYYLQDPSAMATVAAAPLAEGMKVLDLCAAPGGKSGQISERIGADGLLVSNEIVPNRARILVGNLERLGAENAAVLHTDPAGVSALFDRYFDFVLVDAPCSGEGMFRKYPEARAEWSPANVALCAARQKEILTEAAKTVSQDGFLLYSTCTFSVEENEENVLWFLEKHPDFEPAPLSRAIDGVTAHAVPLPDSGEKLAYCRRFYPHLAAGEGQFMALFRRVSGGRGGCLYQDVSLPLPKKEAPAIRAALGELFNDEPDARMAGGNLAVLPRGFALPPYGTFMSGVCLGAWNGKLLQPHHQAFSACGDRMRRTVDLLPDDPRLSAYLRGEEIEVPEASENGFTAVLMDGVPLGGGKVSGGRLKNHYPKGLRVR